jgi:hypothetical protein
MSFIDEMRSFILQVCEEGLEPFTDPRKTIEIVMFLDSLNTEQEHQIYRLFRILVR